MLSSDFMASSIQLVPEAELGNRRRAWAWRLTDERITAFLPPHSLPWPPAAATTQRTPTSLASSLLRIASQGTLTSSTTCSNIEISAYKHPKKIWLRVWGDIGESSLGVCRELPGMALLLPGLPHPSAPSPRCSPAFRMRGLPPGMHSPNTCRCSLGFAV